MGKHDYFLILVNYKKAMVPLISVYPTLEPEGSK